MFIFGVQNVTFFSTNLAYLPVNVFMRTLINLRIVWRSRPKMFKLEIVGSTAVNDIMVLESRIIYNMFILNLEEDQFSILITK